MPKSTDWIKIRNEYINGNKSYRELAKKHKISYQSVARHGAQEKWGALRSEQLNKIRTKVEQKTADKIVDKEAERITKLYELTDKLTPKIDKAISQLETVIVDGKRKKCQVDTYRMRQIMQTLKDLKDIAREDNTSDMAKLDAVLGKIEGNI